MNETKRMAVNKIFKFIKNYIIFLICIIFFKFSTLEAFYLKIQSHHYRMK